MMFSKRTLLTFAVTMMSMFGISYCCSHCNKIELPFINETIEQYKDRTVPMQRIADGHFEILTNYYDRLTKEILDFKILDLVYPLLPEHDDSETDFMIKILALGHCGFGLQIAILRYHYYRLLELKKKHGDEFLTNESVDISQNLILQEIAYLAGNLTDTTSQGRIKRIFMNTFYGNHMPLISGEDYTHDLNGSDCKHHIPGNFIFDFDQQIETGEDDGDRDGHRDGHVFREGAEVSEAMRIKAEHRASGIGNEEIEGGHSHGRFEHVSREGGEVRIDIREEKRIKLDREQIGHMEKDHHGAYDTHGECMDGQNDYKSTCPKKIIMRGLKHSFKRDHCPHCEEYEEIPYETHLSLLAKTKAHITSKFSSWLTDLKKTDPLNGEMHLSYAVRTLRNGRRPLPPNLVFTYYGFTLCNKFHVWPELTATYIMSYLFHCPIGESPHLKYHENEDYGEEYKERSCQNEPSHYANENRSYHERRSYQEHERGTYGEEWHD